MISAVDTNILFDILIPGEPHSESSKRLLDQHLASGRLILCETVFAELAARFPSEQELKLFLADTGMKLVPSNEKSSIFQYTWIKRSKSFSAKRHPEKRSASIK